ncbi:MAG: YiiX/YebB-like N1pC/P60 family cysteine hydrolase [Pseudomonadota bacterium]
MFQSLKLKTGQLLAGYLTNQTSNYVPFSTNAVPVLEQWLEPGDVLLVEGNTRISTVIKYLTQSTWSHAAFFAGPSTRQYTPDGEACPLVEAELGLGVVASPLSKYRNLNTRILRPVNLTQDHQEQVVATMVSSLGKQYDLKHILDLARYLFPLPVPARFRRRMIAFGSGDPSRAICSTLIAETFQSIRYPILPTVEKKTVISPYSYQQREILHIRDHTLFTPRDFDLSPYFRVIKPTIECGFDYSALELTSDPISSD